MSCPRFLSYLGGQKSSESSESTSIGTCFECVSYWIVSSPTRGFTCLFAISLRSLLKQSSSSGLIHWSGSSRAGSKETWY